MSFKPYETEDVDYTEADYHILSPLSKVNKQDVHYLLEPYLPQGEVSILAGVSGVGKTWLALAWAAAVSNGTMTGEERCVYYFTTENSAAAVLRPRLEALGANLDNIFVQTAEGAHPHVMADRRIRDMIEKHDCPALIVYDPIQSYLGAGTDMNRANEIRQTLDRLTQFARMTFSSILLISHMNKPNAASGARALDRMLGSSDFRNAARSILIAGRDPEDADVSVFVHAKNSLGEQGPSQRYKISDTGIAWLGECDLDEEQILRAPKRPRGRPATTRLEAEQALTKLLGPRGWADRKEITALCQQQHISQKTLYKARDSLHLKQCQRGFGPWLRTYWLLPDCPTDRLPPEE